MTLTEFDGCTCDYFEMLKPDGHHEGKKAYRLERTITERDASCQIHS